MTKRIREDVFELALQLQARRSGGLAGGGHVQGPQEHFAERHPMLENPRRAWLSQMWHNRERKPDT
jgi:hypothetical protein